jgi:hypothetical protein
MLSINLNLLIKKKERERGSELQNIKSIIQIKIALLPLIIKTKNYT